jgi:hypothetical protein
LGRLRDRLLRGVVVFYRLWFWALRWGPLNRLFEFTTPTDGSIATTSPNDVGRLQKTMSGYLSIPSTLRALWVVSEITCIDVTLGCNEIGVFPAEWSLQLGEAL